MTSLETNTFMEFAIQQAKVAMDALEVPVGCVIVEDGKVIASGRNRTTETRNATRHAEMEATDVLLEQWQKNGLSIAEVTKKFSNCSLYVTCEPCIMCASALSILGIKEVFYGCSNDKFGGCGSILPLHLSNTVSLNKGFKCVGGIMASEAVLLLRSFYEQGNPNAPKPHRPITSGNKLNLSITRNGWFKFDELGMEMLSIALPAAVALAADPIASLIDTAFVGHIGAVELAAVGVSASVFNLVSKVFNVPLLNITTSFVAEEQARINKEESSSQTEENGKYQSEKLLSSVSTSLALAAALGIAETVALSLGSGILMDIMGIPVDSPMRGPAQQFLALRAFGALPIVVALAAQGTFRGFKDTKTPLYAVGKCWKPS